VLPTRKPRRLVGRNAVTELSGREARKQGNGLRRLRTEGIHRSLTSPPGSRG
jgi:hypothetical protein